MNNGTTRSFPPTVYGKSPRSITILKRGTPLPPSMKKSNSVPSSASPITPEGIMNKPANIKGLNVTPCPSHSTFEEKQKPLSSESLGTMCCISITKTDALQKSSPLVESGKGVVGSTTPRRPWRLRHVSSVPGKPTRPTKDGRQGQTGGVSERSTPSPNRSRRHSLSDTNNLVFDRSLRKVTSAKNNPSTSKVQLYAGPQFNNSPNPSCLPIPVFALRSSCFSKQSKTEGDDVFALVESKQSMGILGEEPRQMDRFRNCLQPSFSSRCLNYQDFDHDFVDSREKCLAEMTNALQQALRIKT